jgi:RNA polymerase sigma-70 factor (ECF subfamily)
MNAQLLSDQELIRHYLVGKEAALEVLINRHKDRIYSYIFFTVRDNCLAEDIFQDTFIKVINTLKRGKYNEEGKFLPWVNRIAHNLIIDHYRKSSRIQEVTGNEDFDIFDVISDTGMNVEENMISKQIRNDVRQMIDYLPDDQKEVLVMRIYQEMSFKEIAEQTNVSINTALGRMRYALINLRKLAKSKNLILSQ